MMSNLTSKEHRQLEKLFNMSAGWVLDFTDRSFSIFFDEYDIEIDAERYKLYGTSKAKRMRGFWKLEPNHIVGKVVTGLIEYICDKQSYDNNNDSTLIDDCRKIAQRLLSGQSVSELDALAAITDERSFEIVAKEVREAINKNQPETGIDRLHTYVNKYIRAICTQYGIETSRDKPLHSICGYVSGHALQNKCSAVQCIQHALAHYTFPANKPQIIFTDTTDFNFYGQTLLIVHVLFNLLKNALYFIQKAKKSSIHIWLELGDLTNTIHFKDTAQGIKPDHLPHIFEPFYTKDTNKGTGIGLAFCHTIMASCGGSIECQSICHEYTEFILHFPQHPPSTVHKAHSH